MDNDSLKQLDPRQLGQELLRARARKGLTQAEAAQVIGVARTTLTAIEKGERKLKLAELIQLAAAYDLPLNDLVRPRPSSEPFQNLFQRSAFRKIDDKEVLKGTIDAFEELARNYAELETLMESPLNQKYPPEYNLDGIKDMDQAGEYVATQERHRLGLGDGPLTQLRLILEQDVGLRVFTLPVQPHLYSGFYVYDHNLGGCLAINRLQAEELRRVSLARLYGHFLTNRFQPTILVEKDEQRVPSKERFSKTFAAHFLMPASGLAVRWTDLVSSKDKVNLTDLIVLAAYYEVPVEALIHRLENLKLLPKGTGDQQQKKEGFQVRETSERYEASLSESKINGLPVRYQYLAMEAFDRGTISEGQLAKFLQVDRLGARALVAELHGHPSGPLNAIELNLAQNVDE